MFDLILHSKQTCYAVHGARHYVFGAISNVYLSRILKHEPLNHVVSEDFDEMQRWWITMDTGTTLK